jgi:uncharacterized protein (TIGR00730 family)
MGYSHAPVLDPHRTPDEELFEVPAALAPGIARGSLRHAHIAESDGALLQRMTEELRDGFETLADVERAVSIFGSARTPEGDPEYELARAVAARLGAEGVAIITGGGQGIMAAANRGAREAGALSIGLTIDLPAVEAANAWIDLPVHFHYFFARKVMFVRYASAFVVFPGGLGTFDELFELVTLIQTQKMHAPPIVLVGRGYWAPLLAWMRETVLAGGKISEPDLELLYVADEVEDVVRHVMPGLGVGEAGA